LKTTTLKNYSNGIGTILINYEKPFSFKLFTFAIEYKWVDQYRRLEFIKNVYDVYNLIIERRKELVVTTGISNTCKNKNELLIFNNFFI
jgi:hypothetical protein